MVNRLKQQLIIIDEVTYSDWPLVWDLIKDWDDIKVLRQEWCDSWKKENPDMYPLDLSTIDTWSTFSSCVNMVFRMNKHDCLICRVTIYDGDINGVRQHRRFTATLKVPLNFLRKIQYIIEYEFNRHCERLHEHMLIQKKEIWINLCKEELLNEPINKEVKDE